MALLSSNRCLWKCRPPLCHPERTRISCHAAPDTVACAPFSRERRMKFANATKFHRKSGAAEGSAVQRTLPGNVLSCCHCSSKNIEEIILNIIRRWGPCFILLALAHWAAAQDLVLKGDVTGAQHKTYLRCPIHRACRRTPYQCRLSLHRKGSARYPGPWHRRPTALSW